jgi:hypothetical protein
MNYLIKQKIKYPDVLINIFNENNEEKFSFSGLFLPLNLLYFVRDNKIYLWDYITNDIHRYEDIPNVIVSLHITIPKYAVFSPDVTFVMIVATTTEIYLVLIIPSRENKSLNFIKSDFIYDVQNVITSICSTAEQRVFLGSQNNYLYELDYTKESSFFGFSKRARKITHSSQSFLEKIVPNVFNLKKHSYTAKMAVDNTRRLLYCLIYYTNDERNIYNTEAVYDSAVHVYDLGVDGMGFEKLGEISQTNIRDRFNYLSGQPNRRENNFIILDIYPTTRAESKSYNLVIVTKMGLRAYIKFDPYFSNAPIKDIKDEERMLEFDKNSIYRIRPSMRYTIILKQIPEPSNATIIQGNEFDPALRALHRAFTYNQIFYLERKFFIFYKDDTKKRAYIDVVEYEESDQVKLQEQFSHLNLYRSKETISNILKFNFNKEVYAMLKVPYSQRSSQLDFDSSSLLKLIDYENIQPRNLNYLDVMNEHLSYLCMHTFAKQLFLPPEEIMVMTSSELVTVSKMRPIDNLFKIILDIDNPNEPLSDEFLTFLQEYGISETAFMLLTIMSNRSFVFYRKFEETVIHDTSAITESHVNKSNILMMDSTEIKNNERTSNFAQILFFKLIEFAVSNGSNKTYLNQKEERKVDSKWDMNIIGQIAEESQTGKINFISYALYMYLARIGRVFWEENIFKRSPDNKDFVSETIKIHQIKYLQSILSDYQLKIRENRDKILQKSSEVEVKIKTSQILAGLYDFSNLSQDLDGVLYLSEKFIEALQFAQILYENKPLKRHLTTIPLTTLKEMTNLKFRDIIKDSNIPMIKQWIEEYFEVALKENDFYMVGNKLDEFGQLCPNILSQNDKEVITANILIRISKTKQKDEISRKNLVSKAINLMTQNPETLKLDKSVRYLAELGEVRSIVEICIKKAMYLKALLEKDGERNLSLCNFESGTVSASLKPLSGYGSVSKYQLSQSESEYYFSEYKQCLYLILKLLNEIQNSIKNHDKGYDPISAPESIRSLLAKPMSLDEKISMRNAVIEEILKHDIKFLHDLLFDHLKSQGMLDDILKYESPYIEPYLSAQIEKEKANPKRYEALYKFHLNSNNYEGALRILLNLINFDNAKIENGDKYVTLEDRRTYCKHLIYTLDKLIEKEQDESSKNFYLKQKKAVVNIRDTYLIQSDIFLYLKNLLEKVSDENQQQTIREALYDLDRNYYNLPDLYSEFSKRFKLYDINIQIFFEMLNKEHPIEPQEVINNYDNFFDWVLRKEKTVNYPQVLLPLMNKIFVNYVANKTQYESFFTMLRENNYKNPIDSVIPLSYLISRIEGLNWSLILKEKSVDFEKNINTSYDVPENPFWFVKFLKEVVNLPCFYIYTLYSNILEECQDDSLSLVYTMDILYIIRLWSVNVEVYFDKSQKGSAVMPKFVSDDYTEFIQYHPVLQRFLRDSYVRQLIK